MGLKAENHKSGALPSKRKVKAIVDLLDQLYPDTHCSLNFKDPLELLVATILSAQCTDERVNMVTPGLFRKYRTAKDFAEATLEALEAEVRSTGFYRNKAKNIQQCCRMLEERFQGQVPADLDALVQLPGVGRKTANVILGNAFNIPGIVVDTHVGRVAQRLGLTNHHDPEKIERDLMALIPKKRWVEFCHQLIQHGRRVCQSRKPKMAECALRPHCRHAATEAESKR